MSHKRQHHHGETEYIDGIPAVDAKTGKPVLDEKGKQLTYGRVYQKGTNAHNRAKELAKLARKPAANKPNS